MWLFDLDRRMIAPSSPRPGVQGRGAGPGIGPQSSPTRSTVTSLRALKRRSDSAFDPPNLLYAFRLRRPPLPTMKGIFLAGNGSRQQHRSSASGAQKEDAARRRVSRDEAQTVLRETVGKIGPGAERSGAAGPQARS